MIHIAYGKKKNKQNRRALAVKTSNGFTYLLEHINIQGRDEV